MAFVPHVLITCAPAHTMMTVAPLTNGDNPGIATGVASGTVMGPARTVTAAFTCLVGSMPLARLTSMLGKLVERDPGLEPRVVELLAGALRDPGPNGVRLAGLGPVLAAFSPHAIGPLSALRMLFDQVPYSARELVDVCADPALHDECRKGQQALRLSGLGPLVMNLMPSIVLLGGPSGCFQHAPGTYRHQREASSSGTGSAAGLNTIDPGTSRESSGFVAAGGRNFFISSQSGFFSAVVR